MRRTRATAGVVAGAAVAVVAIVLITSATNGSGEASHRRTPGPFAWLHPVPPPPRWSAARIAGGAELAYPPEWTPIKTDPGTASVALLSDGRIDGYLNATPKQGTETLANWNRFRPSHNRGEGNRDVRLIASSMALPFRSGRGSCVIDDYTTSSTATFREIACLVSGRASAAVVVAAAPTALWSRQARTLERAVSSFVP